MPYGQVRRYSSRNSNDMRVGNTGFGFVSHPSTFNTARAVGRLAGRAFRRWQNARQQAQNRNRRWPAPRQNRSVANRTGVTVRRAAKRAGRKRLVQRKRAVKVGKRLRDKVNKVINANEDKHEGTYYCYERPQVLIQKEDNLKDIYAYPNYNKGAGNDTNFSNINGGELFSFNRVLDAASKLYNAKASLEEPAINNDNNFDYNKTVIDVNFQKAQFWIRNNSKRTYHLRLYVCKAKQTNIDNASSVNPVQTWRDIVEDYNEAGTGGVKNYTGFGTVNVSVTRMRTQYKCEPDMYPGFNKAFEVKKVDFVVEPGQTTSHTVYGPSGEMSGVDYLIGNQQSYHYRHKGSFWAMWSVLGDFIQTIPATHTTGQEAALGAPIYKGDALESGQDAGGILIECERTIKLNVPERTLGAAIATPGNIEKNQRTSVVSPRLFYEQFFSVARDDTYRVDEQQPENAAAV